MTTPNSYKSNPRSSIKGSVNHVPQGAYNSQQKRLNYSNQKYQKNQDDEMMLKLSPEEIQDRILNEKNIPITEIFINGIFERLGFNHKVKHLENFQRAMVHSSYLEESVSDPKTIKMLKDVAKHFDFAIAFSSLFDSHPVVPIFKFYYNFSNGIVYKF